MTPALETEVVSPAAKARNRQFKKQRRGSGRFSGRLALKDDELKVEEECLRLSPLIGGQGLKRSHSSPLTNVVLGIASGHVRKHCQSQELLLQELSAQLAHMQAMRQHAERMLQEENAGLRATLQMYDALEQRLAPITMA